MRGSLAFVVFAAASLVVTGCSKDAAQAGANMPTPEVGVVTLQPATIVLQQELPGRLAAFRSADVRARVAGIVQRRLYQEGSDVGQGQALFQIDPAPLQASLGAAQASLASAQANAANAHSAAARARQLAPAKFISATDLDNALATERTTAAAVQQAQAALQTARINFGYATVRAPIAGRAGQQQITEGALVGEGGATLLTTIDQIDPLYVELSIGVDDLAKLRALADGGATHEVKVKLADGSFYAQPGTLDFAGDVVDPATGAVSLRARLPNPDHQLLPGSFVTVQASLGEQRDAYRVPQVAVQRDGQGAYVLVVGKDGKVARKGVTTKLMQGSDWVVTDGVAPGDQVIVSGLQRVQPGQAAKIAAPAADGAPQAVPAAAPKG
ncbi:MAG: efflux RND transporter periplasmic adaptor subunit [Thermomonas sp.]